MANLPPLNMPLNIPLIGSRPPPEVVEQHIAQVQAMEALWPITPFPMSGNGMKVPAYWMGQTLLDAFALRILECVNVEKALNNGPKAIEQMAQRVWLMSIAMMQTRPIGQKPATGEETPLEPSAPTAETPMEQPKVTLT